MATCFISIPFDAYYHQVLVRAILRAGLQPVRADDLDKHRAITDQIRDGVSEAAICIVDLTGRSTNALYVLGMAHGMGKPVILILQDPQDLPYDLKLGSYILYRPGTARWEDMLSLQLQAAIRDSAGINFGTAP